MLATCLALLTLAAPTPPRPRPRLVVLVVLDQMPVRAFARARPHFKGGFARTVAEGALRIGRYPYANTVTAAGHAFLATGAPPAESGILQNEWWDRAAGREVFSVDAGDGKGASPGNLRTEGVGDVLAAASGGSAKIVGLSWKDRGAILPVGRRPTAAVWFDVKTLGFATSAYYGALPAFAERANRERPITRHVGAVWKPTLAPPVLSSLCDDAAPGEGDFHGLGTRFPHRLPSAPGHAFGRALAATPFAVDALFELAADAAEALDLGGDDVPDLLTVSVSATDMQAHATGADSCEAIEVLLAADRAFGVLLARLEQRTKGRLAVVVSSDHGGVALPEHTVAELGVPVTELRAPTDRGIAALVKARLPMGWRAEFLHPWLWLLPTVPAPAPRERAIAAAKEALLALPPVLSVWTEADTRRPGDALAGTVARSWDPTRAGDLYVLLRPGAVFDEQYVTGGGTTHGTPWDSDVHVPVVVWGAPVAPSAGPIPMARVPATLADLLGVRPPKAAARAGSLLAPGW